MRAANLPIQLHPRMPAIDAFIALGDAGLVAVADQLDALHRRDHPDDVHALRVAVRHLRAVCWAFAPALPKAIRARWDDCLRKLAQAASDVRDWDVFVSETLRPALDLEPEDPVLLAVHDTAITRRHYARATMLAQLTEYQHWPLPVLHRDLTHLNRGGVQGAGSAAKDHLAEFASRRVCRGRKRVKSLARAARSQDLARVHRFRIGSKRLRYVIEALKPVLPARYAKRLHRKLVKRQGSLGGLIDGVVARRLMMECLNMPAKDAAGAAGTTDVPGAAVAPDRSATISP
ncbi:CHAD domain-containing protein [Cupriavidus sp. D39]|uniref:CHAD domain-containing protein n=1 Tax=Cupriavidus sp. D39 TaxID=2997877 RepID=UPI00226F12B5|nr:CHAD domain-containing protein [Cupriavidus sp. D39]MCY0857107.1 CHAD domain-containing protein [Cupriavidus sp. D39]